MRIPRMSMLRSMVVIGAFAIWIWLTRTALFLLVPGSLVLGLMLHAAARRSRMAGDLEAGREPPTPLSRAGLVGYAIIVLLGLAWVASIAVWDANEKDPSFRGRRFLSIVQGIRDSLDRTLNPLPPRRPVPSTSPIFRRMKPAGPFPPSASPAPASFAPVAPSARRGMIDGGDASSSFEQGAGP